MGSCFAKGTQRDPLEKEASETPLTAAPSSNPTHKEGIIVPAPTAKTPSDILREKILLHFKPVERRFTSTKLYLLLSNEGKTIMKNTEISLLGGPDMASIVPKIQQSALLFGETIEQTEIRVLHVKGLQNLISCYFMPAFCVICSSEATVGGVGVNDQLERDQFIQSFCKDITSLLSSQNEINEL
eukprot:TRINITY_DN3348_c0_g2_i1.p1 TRINITY_DN3348_c0_g2~~TRINITY_DN3348_c0_g2_i1.p1  ORF type:complete len:185 (-),score=27.96 TRINITY_DN3348_c0_g2_i1:85-639(-)